MKQVITGDDSITFYNEEYDETYHSVTGAVEEAFKKFVEPALSFVKDKNHVRVLDVGFGLGYNSAAALDRIFELNPECEASIVGLEKDKEILRVIPGLSCLQIKNYDIIKEMIKCMGRGGAKDKYEYEKGGVRLTLLLYDAVKSIRSVNSLFDIVFLDPFSPRKNPELWTESFFKELRKRIRQDGVLTTYSCARRVRENLRRAGFKVFDGPCVGRRSPSSIATPL